MSAITIVQNDIMRALGDFILSVTSLDAKHIIQGLGNGVPLPKGGFIVMTAISQTRLSTNVRDYAHYWADLRTDILQPVEQVVQIDCYGELAGEWATFITTVFRDIEGCDAFPKTIKPLYCGDPKLMPFETAEQNYMKRWSFDVHLQFNPVMTI